MTLRVFDGEQTSERHDHYDADGNLTGHTIITRESEWDDRTRTEALAAVYADWSRCKQCGLADVAETESMFEHTREWVWLDGRVIEVSAVRCLGCAAIETNQRRWEKLIEHDKPAIGTYARNDGVTWRAEWVR